MAKCSYCGKDETLTREHVYSSSVLEIFRDVAPRTYDHERGVVHGADPVIRDLCAKCNGELSPLDAEMANTAAPPWP